MIGEEKRNKANGMKRPQSRWELTNAGLWYVCFFKFYFVFFVCECLCARARVCVTVSLFILFDIKT